MHKITSLVQHACAVFLMTLFLTQAAQAQTSAALLVKPWPEANQFFEGSADAYFFDKGHTRQSDAAFQLYHYESSGRFRILPGNEISPRIGYDFSYIDNHTHFPRIPDQLTNVSLALGTGIARSNGWLAGITLGGGYAGGSAFEHGSAWYGKADLVIAKEISETDTLGIILDYDGNRAYLPDSPLPGVGYSHRFDKRLKVVVGLPYTSLSWQPIDHLDIQAEYQLYNDLKVSLGYEFIPHLFAFGSYGYIREAFQGDNLGNNHRLLYYQRRVEAGIRYVPDDHLTFKAAIGYGWDGSYRSGFDFRRSTLIAEFSDEPYLHVGVEIKY